VPGLAMDFENFLRTSAKKFEPLVGTNSAEGYSMVETTQGGRLGVDQEVLVFSP